MKEHFSYLCQLKLLSFFNFLKCKDTTNMRLIDDLKTALFEIHSEKDFNNLAIEVFSFQYNNNKVYNRWCNLLNVEEKQVKTVEDIPFLPISFFKTNKITSFEGKEETFFLSSGTTSIKRSKHLIYDKSLYLKNCEDCFSQFYDKVEDYCFICLLPNYLEQGNSSLICMMNDFVQKSKDKGSDFFKTNLNDVVSLLGDNERKTKKTILFGVTYALLDLIEKQHFQLQHTIVFETGGMKGKREEMLKSELHKKLSEGFGVKSIASEYGMCELFSQAYSLGEGIFACPKQMKVMIKEINDYKSHNIINHSGVINIIDLANIYTCSFIETEDIGRQKEDGTFEIMGRKDHSAIRGCNLMYDI